MRARSNGIKVEDGQCVKAVDLKLKGGRESVKKTNEPGAEACGSKRFR